MQTKIDWFLRSSNLIYMRLFRLLQLIPILKDNNFWKFISAKEYQIKFCGCILTLICFCKLFRQFWMVKNNKFALHLPTFPVKISSGVFYRASIYLKTTTTLICDSWARLAVLGSTSTVCSLWVTVYCKIL